MNKIDIKLHQKFFFIGIAGVGMSAIAQYLVGTGKTISGSDRQFNSDKKILVQKQLEEKNIKCFPQDCSGINENTDIVVISSAIEPTVPEYKKALDLGLKIVHRSDLLAAICETKNTIAVSGTSGKSTVSAMLFQILNYSGLNPSLITGAGLISLQKKSHDS